MTLSDYLISPTIEPNNFRIEHTPKYESDSKTLRLSRVSVWRTTNPPSTRTAMCRKAVLCETLVVRHRSVALMLLFATWAMNNSNDISQEGSLKFAAICGPNMATLRARKFTIACAILFKVLSDGRRWHAGPFSRLCLCGGRSQFLRVSPIPVPATASFAFLFINPPG